MTKEEEIAAKVAEIEEYERVLANYGRGRWYNLGQRNLTEKKEELKVLCGSSEE